MGRNNQLTFIRSFVHFLVICLLENAGTTMQRINVFRHSFNCLCCITPRYTMTTIYVPTYLPRHTSDASNDGTSKKGADSNRVRILLKLTPYHVDGEGAQSHRHLNPSKNDRQPQLSLQVAFFPYCSYVLSYTSRLYSTWSGHDWASSWLTSWEQQLLVSHF